MLKRPQWLILTVFISSLNFGILSSFNFDRFLNECERFIKRLSNIDEPSILDKLLAKKYELAQFDDDSAFCFLVGKSILTDLATIWHELDKIDVLASRNKKDIKEVSRASRKYNLLSGPISIVPKILVHAMLNESMINNKDNLVQMSRFANYLPSLMAWRSLYYEGQITRNAKAIAKYNDDNNRTLSVTKFIQKLWLFSNKVLPYAGLYDFSKLDSEFNKINFNKNKKFEVLSVISNLSEMVRKYFRYKSEIGSYKLHKNYKKQR